MSSANDSSVALAEEISGSESSFVNKMNSTAKNLGMNNTLYCNCTGLPAPEQYSTAYDCAVLLRNLIKYDLYHKYSNIWMDELVHPSGRKTELVNTNKLVKYYNGCDCGKTGSTSEAGYCLTSSAIRDNMRFCCFYNFAYKICSSCFYAVYICIFSCIFYCINYFSNCFFIWNFNCFFKFVKVVSGFQNFFCVELRGNPSLCPNQ